MHCAESRQRVTRPERVVIVGAGHAGVQAASSLRDEGYAGEIFLVSAEEYPPYQRPPLSKAFLKGEASAENILLRGPGFFKDRQIELLLDRRVSSIERPESAVVFEDGSSLSYSHLVLATGAIPKRLPFAGQEFAGVHTLHNLRAAQRLKSDLASASNVVVIGAGFIGLEFSASAASSCRVVHVVEVAARVMGRAVSPPTSEFFAYAHRALGIQLHLGTSVSAIEGRDGRVTTVHLADGRELTADLVVIGIGIIPSEELARNAGLEVDDGVVVDATLGTSDPRISAIGDCANHPSVFGKKYMRLESVQNAVDQARTVAKNICGRPMVYEDVPWFWSDQSDLKLQIAGLLDGCDQFVLRGTQASRHFSVFGFAAGRLRVVESINRPGDHMIARRLLQRSTPVGPSEVSDQSFDLKALVK